MPYIADRVAETTTTTGTGAITLAGAKAGYQSFATALGSASSLVGYTISDGTNWETGRGTFNGTTGLTRDNVIASSNANALVNFAAGSKDVWIDATSQLLRNSNSGRQLAYARGMAWQ